MSRLPSHHISRPRLTLRCADAGVVLLEAAGGYGKSVFAAELTDAWGAVLVEVLLEEGPISAQLFASRLQAAVARAGFPEAAASVVASGEDVVGGVDALMTALSSECCAFVIDDAHHCDRSAGLIIDRIASQLSASQHLVVACRKLPQGMEKARRAPSVRLVAKDLRLEPEETLELCRTGFGLEITQEVGHQLDEATGGWTAAAVLAASRARSTGEGLLEIARVAADSAHTEGTVASLLEEAVLLSGVDRSVLAALGRLPLFDRQIVDEVAGEGFFDRSLGLGLPFSSLRDRWWSLPGPVRDYLAGLGEADSMAMRRAAINYAEKGELRTALEVLVSAGEPETAAEILSAAQPRDVDALDVLELLAIVDRLPPQALREHPLALIHVARACESAGFLEKREETLSHLVAAASKSADPALQADIDVERACDLMRDISHHVEAEELAKKVLESAPPSALLARARALSALGRATCWHVDERGCVDQEALRRGARYLEQAFELFVELELGTLASGVAVYRAMWTEFGVGHAEKALEILNQALELLVDRRRRYAWVLQFRAEVLTELGRHDEVHADVNEIIQISTQLGHDPQLTAYAHFDQFISDSYRGDAEATLERVRLTEAHRDEWWRFAGSTFMASAADNLDRVGYTTLAFEYLQRAQSDPGDAGPLVDLAECAILARHGDPVVAEERLSGLVEKGLEVREYWRVTLFRAYAALRRGDPGAGAMAARAFEEAANLGQPQLPLIRERELTEALLGLAAETGLPAAIALEASSLPLALNLLGGFELTLGGRSVPLGGGQAAQLLKLVSISEGRLLAERAIEALWPESDPDAGRNRLRTVLNRLREVAGDVMTRERDLLVLSPSMRIDLAQFHAEARQALALGVTEPTAAVAVARSAISRYRGDLLPHDPYEAWTELPRQQARNLMLDLLDLCAGAAAERGDLDELRRVVVRTIELAPQDDGRYLRAALLLLEQGRKGAALTVVRRARAALSDLGLEPPLQLVSLEKDLVA
jgi:DNA-binding SARP family transcriptional activator/ATP/maltotriose-dependent transcriptional regulator MalT